MTFINTWKDVTSFAGQVVAYKTSSEYLSHGMFHFPNSDLNFGILEKTPSKWQVGGKGYNLIRLVPYDKLTKICAFVDNELKDSKTSMRRATTQEVAKIKGILFNQMAQLNLYGNKDHFYEVLNRSRL